MKVEPGDGCRLIIRGSGRNFELLIVSLVLEVISRSAVLAFLILVANLSAVFDTK